MAASGGGIRLLSNAAFAAGAVGLGLAMVSDFASVVARRLGHPISGALDVVQAAIVLAAASALVAATASGGHAAIHVITERLPQRVQGILTWAARLCGALLMAILCGAGLWILGETWAGREATDSLGLPIAPLRIVWALATGLAAVMFLAAPTRREADAPAESEGL